MDNAYRPPAGKSIFMSLYNQRPFLSLIKGYHHDPRFTSEQVDYIDPSGKRQSSSLNEAKFYPDAPISSRYIYIIEQRENEEYVSSNSVYELGFFFSADEAFEHLAGLEDGSIKSSIGSEFDQAELLVVVEKINS